MEFITGVFSSNDALLSELTDIHSFTRDVLKTEGEQLWPMSMPSILPLEESEIPLADFGKSNVGQLKTLYRKGLGHRYGRSMQSIAGVHYNFSLSDNFWNYIKESENLDLDLQEIKNKYYFKLIRNYKRYCWVLTYLFGASNIVHKSFLHDKKHSLEKLSDDLYYSPYATSLRMGGLGYTSNSQKEISICFNKVETYIKTLEKARLQTYADYAKIGVKKDGEYLQLNDHLLQIDNEFYSTIRPKNIAKSKESALGALYSRGIEYIEVRILDVNPFDSNGIDEQQLNFLHVFLLWCLVKDSPQIGSEECHEVENNLLKVVTNGRDVKNTLLREQKEILMTDYLEDIFDELSEFAEIFSGCSPEYSKAISKEFLKVKDQSLLPSSQLVDLFEKNTFSAALEKLMNKNNKSNYDLKRFELCRDLSFEKEKEVLRNERLNFDDFLVQYFEDIKIKEL